MPDMIFALILIFLAVWLYFAPTWIAYKRNAYNIAPILIINMFFGWTLLGWGVCLAWAFTYDNP